MAVRAASLFRATAALALLLSLCAAPSHGFWFSTSARSKSQAPQWFGIRDYGAPSQAAYSYDSSGGVTVAVPVAVPLSPQQVQVSPPYPGLGAVQLVPCLCPISKDPENVQSLPPMSQQQGPSYAPLPPQMSMAHPQMVPLPPQMQQMHQMQQVQLHPMPPPLHQHQHQQQQSAPTQSPQSQQQQQQQQQQQPSN